MRATSVGTRFLLAASIGVLLGPPAAAQTRLLRFPDIHGDHVVFTYAGDLWTAPDTGGTAIRLTAHPGLELFARYSPSGDQIAFTGQYDGDEQVYVIPATGGEPRQLTFYPANGPLPTRWGYDHQVYGWTPDGSAVVFRSLRDGWDLADSHLYTVPAAGGLPTRMPMPQSGAGDVSPDGRHVAYSPLFRDFRAWKRYSGGWAEDLWTFDLDTNQARQITDDPRTDRDPMWIGDRVYFNSDRTGKLNLYSVRPDGSDLVQLTRQETWDVRWPGADEAGRIVYELGGELHVLDTRNGKDQKLDIVVPDDGVSARPRHVNVADNIEDFSLAPGGKRALFVARGDVFTAPAERGPTRNLTHSSSAHDKAARWSPDGRKIAFISDMSGEEELYLVDQDGTGKPERLTTGGDMMRYAPVWSPDGERMAFSDKSGRLWLLSVASQDLTFVARDSTGFLTDQSWSPDGRWLAFSTTDAAGFRSIYVRGTDEPTPHRVTGPMTNDREPVFSTDGQYLYFLSDHEYAPLVSSDEWDYATNRRTGVYALALRKDVPAPFPPRSDEAAVDTTTAVANTATSGAGRGQSAPSSVRTPPEVRIDFDGLADRIARVPMTPENYANLTAIKGHLLYMRSSDFYYGRESAVPAQLISYDLEKRAPTTLADSVSGYSLSPDGTHVLVRRGRSYSVYDVSAGAGASPQRISTADLQADVVPKQEWAEIFNETWRRFRDFFYVPNMNGYDWVALRDQYRPLLQYVRDRSTLNDVLSEMIAELSNSHTYIVGGDLGLPSRPDVALPGARFELDRASGRYRIAEIFRGDNAEPEYRAPLTEIGVDAHVGDYVLAIDGQDLRAPQNPYELLRYKSDRPVVLTLNARPNDGAARTVTFEPIGSETKLVYYDWVERNRARVDSLSQGRIGYIHLPDMGNDGISEFVKWFYPQVRKEALIIDDRGNGGGNVSSMVLERLQRTLLASGYSRNNDFPDTYPRGPVFYGPMAVLLNETSASDGDIFPAMFRQAGLGPLIGQRSWGGVTGITNHGPLIDGGTVNVPEFGFTSVTGEWIIEGHGVDPDIVVKNDPESVLAGRDPQLERAVSEILTRLREHPQNLPSRPAPPNRAGGASQR
jgi:tricorn protease